MKRSLMLRLAAGLLAVLVGGAGADRYVATNGPHTAPFSDWSTAATSIQAAVSAAAAGETIWVSNGTYYVITAIDIGGSNTLRSVNGPAVTIVDGSATTRCFVVHHAGAVVDGFTMTNGVDYVNGYGGGFRIYTGGVIRNCVISGNAANNGGAGWMTQSACLLQDCVVTGNRALAGHGGGLFVAEGSGIVRNCRISRNTASLHGGGAIINETTGLIENCHIFDNECGASGWGGGVLLQGGGYLRNCLIVSNRAAGACGGLGVNYLKLKGGEVDSCTIVSNAAATTGGGIYIFNTMNEDAVFNCVISSNTAGSYPNVAATGVNTNAFRYCCAQFTVAPQPNAGNISADPQFVNPAGGNYRLAGASPCVNTGTNLNWMTGAVDLDGHARLDRFTRQADMGCYEYIYSGSVISLR